MIKAHVYSFIGSALQYTDPVEDIIATDISYGVDHIDRDTIVGVGSGVQGI